MMLKIAKILTVITVMLSFGHTKAFNMTTSSNFTHVEDACGYWFAFDGKYRTNDNCK